MTATSRRVAVILTTLMLIAAACGNSGDDDGGDDGALGTDTTDAPEGDDGGDDGTTTEAPSTTGDGDDGTTTEAPSGDDGGPSERDTFVAIEGVPGVDDDAIRYAVIGTREGNPLGTCILDCYAAGINAYFAWRNSEGGVYGRDLVLDQVIDDELANNQARALEVVADDNVFGAFSATLVASGWGDLDDAGIPTYVWGIHAPEVADRQNIFGHLPAGCFDCTQRGVPYAASISDATTVASLGYAVPNSAACATAVWDSIELYADDLGLSQGYLNDGLSFGQTQFGPEVSAMKDAGVDFISTCMDLNGMLSLAQELQRQDMGDVKMYHPNTYNHPFVADSDGLFEGDIVVSQFLPFEYESGLETQQQFFTWMENEGEELSELAMIGWINADMAFVGLMEAGPEFDRQAVIDGLNTQTAYTAGGLLNPIDWTRQHSPPTEGDPTNDYEQECFAPVRVENNEFVPVNPIETPWSCWSNESTDWAEPTLTSFE